MNDMTPLTSAALKDVARARENYPRESWKHHDGLIRSHVKLELDRANLIKELRNLMLRCDGEEGVRSDGSNIQTMAASALLQSLDASDQEDA